MAKTSSCELKMGVFPQNVCFVGLQMDHFGENPPWTIKLSPLYVIYLLEKGPKIIVMGIK